jgi:hypothetical protein
MQAAAPVQTTKKFIVWWRKISEDMNFDWVKQNNIHNVYQQMFIPLLIKMPILVKIGTKLNWCMAH